jgi:tetratricopeptide (TPR) repeat protein
MLKTESFLTSEGRDDVKPTKVALFAIVTCLSAGSAGAAITVIGNSAARSCYEHADSETLPLRSQLADCDRALSEEAISEQDVVATHVNRGILRSRQGDVAGALADFNRASALNPNEPEAYLNKALVLVLRTKQPSEALPLFNTALEKKTSKPALAYFGRGAAYEDLGNVRSAYADYAQAAAADPKWNAPRVELARFNVRKP